MPDTSPTSTSGAPSGPFAREAEVLAYLDGLGQFRMQLGLERMQQSLHALGHQPPPCTVLRVVGTNGKGMVSWLVARLAAAHGLTVGLYTSPHFLSPKERIQVLRPASSFGLWLSTQPDEATWLDLANTVHAAGPAVPPDWVQGCPAQDTRELAGLTYFEFLTAMALEHFARQRVDLAVLEAGLGARHDATAAVRADLVCFTRIGRDHEQVLGAGIAAIARDKAHALRQGARLGLSVAQSPEAWDELEQAAGEAGVPLLAVNQTPPPPVELTSLPALPGSHQLGNARLALAAWQVLAAWRGAQLDPQRCATVLRHCGLPGRFQRVPACPGLHPPLILDGAHNEDALRALGAALRDCGLRPGACIAALMADKDLAELVPLLAGLGSGPLILPRLPEIPRAAPPESLAALLPPEARQRVRIVADLPEALRLANSLVAPDRSEEPLLVCGSLYLLGEFYRLRPELVDFNCTSHPGA